MNRNIVAVQFRSKSNPADFTGREYTYYSEVNLSVGDVIAVPTSKGGGVARVCKVGLKPSQIDERIEKYMMTIEELVRPEEQKCRVCGCTWERACPGGCYWVEPDLCSACVGREPPERSD